MSRRRRRRLLNVQQRLGERDGMMGNPPQATVNLNAAGNVVVPAYLALRAKGYVVRCERSSNESENWIAEGPLGRFGADDPISLLGVVGVAETRGVDWPASDSEIESFLKTFGDPRGG
jgi:hypothetical protein